jgi:hypothetical protein
LVDLIGLHLKRFGRGCLHHQSNQISHALSSPFHASLSAPRVRPASTRQRIKSPMPAGNHVAGRASKKSLIRCFEGRDRMNPAG